MKRGAKYCPNKQPSNIITKAPISTGRIVSANIQCRQIQLQKYPGISMKPFENNLELRTLSGLSTLSNANNSNTFIKDCESLTWRSL